MVQLRPNIHLNAITFLCFFLGLLPRRHDYLSVVDQSEVPLKSGFRIVWASYMGIDTLEHKGFVISGIFSVFFKYHKYQTHVMCISAVHKREPATLTCNAHAVQAFCASFTFCNRSTSNRSQFCLKFPETSRK